jgi:hypothetical protein
MRRILLCLLFICLVSSGVHADPVFDLAGPKVDVHVKRGEATLPIGEVPNLLPGDRLWIHADLPESQSARYVLIVSFLRGATNPPPPEWFTRVETWNHEVEEEGVFVTVPAEAEQALIFLAPETGGDFSTLRAAVRGRPGAFVRAAQDLQAASWDRMRVEAYIAQVKVTSQTDLKSLKDHAEMSARSLGIKINQQCFDKPIEQQATCLAQNPEGLVMDDANAQSLVAQLTNGSTLELMNAISSTSMAGGGAYSPYVGAIVDTARILSSMHTAHFQYIPALAMPLKDTLNLRLNMPPSFRDPKSVVVVALPPVGASKPPPLHPVDSAESFCVQKQGLVLPAEGAPLVFATQMAHDLVLHMGTRSGPVDIPLKVDASEGGLVLTHPPTLDQSQLTGVVRGKWGFDDWEGARYNLYSPRPGVWTLRDDDQSALVVGRQDTLHFDGESSLCVDRVEQQTASGNPLKLSWRSPRPESLEVAVPMKNAAPGQVTLEIYQFGLKKPDRMVLKAYAEAASLDRLTLNAGDTVALLKGTRLDEVAKAELEGIQLSPAHLSRVQGSDQLELKAASSTASLDPTKPYFANVQLRDGRRLKAPVTVEPPRPAISLMSKGVQDDAANTETASPVTLGSPDDLPVDGRLVFFLKSSVPIKFARDEKVEVAAADDSFHTILTLADGSLMLEDAKTAIGSVEPLARFGSSAFGPVRVRAIAADGTSGDWLPLGTLVRLPGFKELRCPHNLAKPCILKGMNLFLATAVGATPGLDNAADVPPDFTGTELSVPHPANGALYFKLRDDPATVQTLTLPILPMATPMGRTATPQIPPVAAPATPAETPETQPGAPAGSATQPAPSAAPDTKTATPPASAAGDAQPGKPGM